MSVILVDCDEVLTGFVPHVLNTARMYYGVDVTTEDISSFDLFAQLGLNKKAQHNLKDEFVSKAQWWEAMPVREGAAEFVNALRDRGHGITVVSSPWVNCPGWENARRNLLKREFGISPKQFISTSDKARIRGDIFIDDKVSNVEEWAQINEGRLAILVDQPHNRENTKLLRLRSFEEILQAIDTYEEKRE